MKYYSLTLFIGRQNVFNRRRQHEIEMHGPTYQPTAIRNTTLYSLSTENETPAELYYSNVPNKRKSEKTIC
jgi:hypothetical protein